MSGEVGRRERKKALTRKAIGDAALALFLEHGYEKVGVRQIAEAADVSVTTLFSYFPTKESLAFDDSETIDAAITAAVRGRTAADIVPALKDFIVQWSSEVASYPHAEAFARMIEETPALQTYSRRVWLRHETTLASVIEEAIGAEPGDAACGALARFSLEAFDLAYRQADPVSAVEVVFRLLEQGWAGTAQPSPLPAG